MTHQPIPKLGFALRLWRDQKALAFIEFALILPVFVIGGFMGIEVAYMATVNMQVSDIALSVADNASRIGQTDNGAVIPVVSEADIASVMKGAREHGSTIDFANNGKVILSSLERDNSTGRQYIHWQRCTGSLTASSAYGPAGTGKTGAVLAGMGRSTSLITAPSDKSVMFAEVVYRYTPLFANSITGPVTFRQEAAFMVRDRRDLAGNGGTGVTGTNSSPCS